MTPRKVDHGQQPNKEQEFQWAVSQKRWSQSRSRDEANPKKGRTEGKGKSGKIQVSIDWTTTGIRKPVSKPDSRPPSSIPNVSGASGDQPPRMKSTVTKGSQKHTSGSRDRTSGQEGRSSRTSSNTQLGDPEKKELRDKPHRWIESWVKGLDPAGYMEEINSALLREKCQLLHLTDRGHSRLGPEIHGCGIQIPYTHISSVLVHPPTRVSPGQSSSPCQAVSGEHAQRGHAR